MACLSIRPTHLLRLFDSLLGAGCLRLQHQFDQLLLQRFHHHSLLRPVLFELCRSAGREFVNGGAFSDDLKNTAFPAQAEIGEGEESTQARTSTDPGDRRLS